ncbi:hypothetical protein INT47_008403 [Mucor saturninus]|uniref:Uncharacterized protein n=1 Tax=Mucor saturninus TaxID=64648 RepID=A0A8H7QHG8_9FUNG|nr:hypothetical protein INT47_008403 [Mucor saturninus]
MFGPDANYIKWGLYVSITTTTTTTTTTTINAIGCKVDGCILYKIDTTQEALDICQTEAAKATNNIQKIPIDKVKLTVKTKCNIDNTVSRPNFSPTSLIAAAYSLIAAIYSVIPVFYSLITAIYGLLIAILQLELDLKLGRRNGHLPFFIEEPRDQIDIVFNNYGGLQTNSVSVLNSSERAIDKGKVSDAESLNTPESCQAEHDSSSSILVEDSESASFITDTSDESFQGDEPASDLGECLRLREYILELKEFGNPMPKNQVFNHSMDNAQVRMEDFKSKRSRKLFPPGFRSNYKKLWVASSQSRELGCGEIKVDGADDKLKDEVRARIGERLKKRLHCRIKEAKSEREFHVFGMFIADNIVELYHSSFSKEYGYDFVLLSKSILPTLNSTYTAIEESIEILSSFKESITKTMQESSEHGKPYIYHQYFKYFKPTISFT